VQKNSFYHGVPKTAICGYATHFRTVRFCPLKYRFSWKKEERDGLDFLRFYHEQLRCQVMVENDDSGGNDPARSGEIRSGSPASLMRARLQKAAHAGGKTIICLGAAMILK